jgi:homoserine kinase type II
MRKTLKFNSSKLPLPFYLLQKIQIPQNGSSQRVFIFENKVFKIFEKDEFELELKLNKILLDEKLEVPRILDYLKIEENFIIVYEKILGKSLKKASKIHLKKICNFLDKLHQVKFDTKREIFKREKLEEFLEKREIFHIKKILDEIQDFPEDTKLIHGDLFLDNAKFIGENLSGVYDFEFASNGAKELDFAILAISWCKDKNTLSKECLKEILKWLKIDFLEFLEYIKYALVFYATIRFIDNRNYQELLNLYNNLKESRCKKV